jgi:hypothetical protein
MSALYPRGTDTIFRVGLWCLPVGVFALWAVPQAYIRSPYYTGQNASVRQPIDFDHRHHVKDDHIDCKYCHTSVETSPSAGYPPVSLCLNCHAQVWNEAPILDPLRKAWFAGEPLRWKRVHKLPDYVFFNHAAHVTKGVGCEECHGRVDQMAEATQVKPLTMAWCLDCHRDPTPHLRPPNEVTQMGWQAPGDARQYGGQLAQWLDVKTRTSCTTCHR